jgi:Fic family protein
MDWPTRRVETDRFGPFTFQVGVDPAAMETPLLRAEDAWRRFCASPLAQVAARLQREVLVQSVYGTNTIEGAELTEEETSEALDLDPAAVQVEQDIRVRNIRSAYDLATRAGDQPAWTLDLPFVQAVHSEICRDLETEDNRAGRFRDNPKTRPTVVGSAEYGGIYRPPQYGRDIQRLMEALADWHATLQSAGLPPMVRAPLVHLYFEWIHPFWDGNGRVGRVLEAALLRHAGLEYAPFAMAKYYQEHIHRYFTLFNQCRKLAEAGDPRPHTPFIELHLEGLRVVCDRLHDRVNAMVGVLLHEASLRQMLEQKTINARQYALIRLVADHGTPVPTRALKADPRFRALYFRLTDRTANRDLAELQQHRLLLQDADGNWVTGFRKA